MDVTSLYTKIPQEEGITTECRPYENFHTNNPPIPTQYLKEMLSLILKENSFQFNGKNYLQIHGTATIWKRYIDDIFSLWDVSKPDIDKFIEQVNSHYPTIKFTAEILNTETTFVDTVVYKGKRFRDQSILDIRTCQKGIREGRSSKTLTN